VIAPALALWLAAADGGAPAAPAGPPPTAAPAATSAPTTAPATGGERTLDRARARNEHAEAMTKLQAGAVDEAVPLFAAAAEHDPSSATIATDYGFALGRAGRRVEAEAMLRGAVEKDPKRFYAYVNLADLWATDPGRWERREAAIAFLDKGLAAVKDDRKGRFSLLLAMAGFERAVGRTAAARTRLGPLLAPDAPPLPRAQRKRVLDLLDAIALDERAHALEDWPEPTVALADRARLETLEREADRAAALPGLDALLGATPGWARARIARAHALEAAGRVDEAVRDLEIAVNLAPSSAEAWRALGRLLALHGGALELERADEALRQALTLEPAWSDLRELRARIARRRTSTNASASSPAGTGASERARALFQEAEEWIDLGDPGGFGRERLEEALADSPGFVAAAISMYAISGQIPKATIDALSNDGPGLWALASGVRKLGRGPGATGGPETSEVQVREWIDRAVALDVQEARFARAASRAAAGDRAGALADLVAYVAREPNPEHLAEAQALRAGLAGRGADGGDGRLPPQLLARIRLLEDRPEAAVRALGGTCSADLPADRLLALGVVQEYTDHPRAARLCYERAGDAALPRLARLDARLPDAELRAADRRSIVRAADQGSAAAEWTLARLASLSGDDDEAGVRVERALARAATTATDADSWIPQARAAAERLATARRTAARARQDQRRWAAAAAVLLAALAGLTAARRRFRGSTVAAALRRRPGLYPEVARAIGELRHDVLKHRAGVLGLVADPAADTAEIARVLTEPRPASAVVATIYDRLATAAHGARATLRPIAREPVFGAMARDLARAEALLVRPERAEARAALVAIDGRLRNEHADALTALLRQGPRTRLDPSALSAWIGAAEAASGRDGGTWTPPALALADLDVDFPIEAHALEAIFSNLLRNAQTAVAGQPDARVLVRVDRERDVTGRQTVTLLVGDSAPAPLTLETIEGRETGRGLAIVRDLVRSWHGQLVVRPEAAPLTKGVGACFPL
jgi:tetratricopeptide (TPR) repeat protein